MKATSKLYKARVALFHSKGFMLRGFAVMRFSHSAFSLFSLFFLCICQSTACKPAESTPTPQTVSLRLHADSEAPLDALVTVDDQILGPLSYVVAHGVALPHGRHRISIEKQGYFPFDHIVETKGAKDNMIVVDCTIPKLPE